jgi:hypothetical protein
MDDCGTIRKRHNEGTGECAPAKMKFPSIAAIVNHYIKNRRAKSSREMKYFGSPDNLPEAIRRAALAINCKGKRHSHQRRIPGATLEHWRKRLLTERKPLQSSKNFVELMAVTKRIGAGIWKNGALTIYDTTHRIGAHLGIEPGAIYLHTGARQGAMELGFKGNREFIFPNEFPKAFRRLKPYEIEDCLCVYKIPLRQLRRQGKISL